VLYMQKGLQDRPRPVLDPNTISPDGSVAVRDFAISPDGRLLAYSESRGGSNTGEIRLRELSTGRLLGEVLRDFLTSICWTRDSRGFFYVGRPAQKAGEPEYSSRLET